MSTHKPESKIQEHRQLQTLFEEAQTDNKAIRDSINPILSTEDADEFDMVPENIECDFTLRCKGDSMINARIFDGDVVYIRSQPEVENGEIAAVRIGDEATLKRVYFTPGSDRITLRACNPLFPDLVYDEESLNDIEILGKAVAFTSMIRT